MRRWAPLFVLLLFPGQPQAETFELGGYELWLNCAQRGDRLVVEGRISHGAPCRNLRIDAWAESSQGERKKIQAWVKDAGGFGSRLVAGEVKAGKATRSWRINDVELRCLAR